MPEIDPEVLEGLEDVFADLFGRTGARARSSRRPSVAVVYFASRRDDEAR